jgi:tetratricopeptide (TPR) repeat protein
MAGRSAVDRLLEQNPGKMPSVLLKAAEMKSKPPADSEQHRERGNALFKRGAYVEAVAEYEAGLRLGNTAVLRCNRAVALRKLSRFRDALDDCMASLRLDPQYTKAMLTGATCATSLGLFDEAASLYAQHASTGKDVEEARIKAERERVVQMAADVRTAATLMETNPQVGSPPPLSSS